MAKGQMRNNKEAKKPKADKPKSSVSDYKKSQGATGQARLRRARNPERMRPATKRLSAAVPSSPPHG